jgi:hypothetical protein
MGSDVKFIYRWWDAVDVLGGRERQVAEGLFRFMDKDAWCYPSERTLAWRLGVSESTVRRGIKSLVGSGWIVKTQRPRGTGSPGVRNAYQGQIPNSYGELRRQKNANDPRNAGQNDRPSTEDEDGRSLRQDDRSQRQGSPVNEGDINGQADPITLPGTLPVTPKRTPTGRTDAARSLAAGSSEPRPQLTKERISKIQEMHATFPDASLEELSRMCRHTVGQVEFALGQPR